MSLKISYKIDPTARFVALLVSLRHFIPIYLVDTTIFYIHLFSDTKRRVASGSGFLFGRGCAH